MSNRFPLTTESFALTYQLPEPQEFLELGGEAEHHARICAAAQNVTPTMHAVNAAYAQFIENCKTRAKPVDGSLADYKNSLRGHSAASVSRSLWLLSTKDVASISDAFAAVDRALGGMLAARRADLMPELEREILVQHACGFASAVARKFDKGARRAIHDTVELYEESWPPSGDFPGHYSWISSFRRELAISAV